MASGNAARKLVLNGSKLQMLRAYSSSSLCEGRKRACRWLSSAAEQKLASAEDYSNVQRRTSDALYGGRVSPFRMFGEVAVSFCAFTARSFSGKPWVRFRVLLVETSSRYRSDDEEVYESSANRKVVVWTAYDEESLQQKLADKKCELYLNDGSKEPVEAVFDDVLAKIENIMDVTQVPRFIAFRRADLLEDTQKYLDALSRGYTDLFVYESMRYLGKEGIAVSEGAYHHWHPYHIWLKNSNVESGLAFEVDGLLLLPTLDTAVLLEAKSRVKSSAILKLEKRLTDLGEFLNLEETFLRVGADDEDYKALSTFPKYALGKVKYSRLIGVVVGGVNLKKPPSHYPSTKPRIFFLHRIQEHEFELEGTKDVGCKELISFLNHLKQQESQTVPATGEGMKA